MEKSPVATLLGSSVEIEARYQRAQAMEQGVRTKHVALNATIVPQWIGTSDAFIYQRELGNGRRFVRVDAAGGTSKDAFEHVEFARALAEAGQPVDS